MQDACLSTSTCLAQTRPKDVRLESLTYGALRRRIAGSFAVMNRPLRLFLGLRPFLARRYQFFMFLFNVLSAARRNEGRRG